MADLYGLTEKDRDDLRALLTSYRQGRINPSNRAAEPAIDYPTSGCYIAYAPVGIEAALEISGTGTGTSVYLEPGAALCDVYRLLDLNGTPTLYPLSVKSQMVFNISDAALAMGSWLLILQDKFNTWYAATSGGGTPGTIGDEMRKVVPTTALGPSPGSGTGSVDDFTYLWSGYYCNIALGAFELGEIIPASSPIYIIQRTQTSTEPGRLLKINGVYTGHFLGFSDQGLGFRATYGVLGAVNPSVDQEVVTDILGLTVGCNGDGTVTGTVSFTKATIEVSAVKAS